MKQGDWEFRDKHLILLEGSYLAAWKKLPGDWKKGFFAALSKLRSKFFFKKLLRAITP